MPRGGPPLGSKTIFLVINSLFSSKIFFSEPNFNRFGPKLDFMTKKMDFEPRGGPPLATWTFSQKFCEMDQIYFMCAGTEFIIKLWYFWKNFLSLRNRKNRKLRWCSGTFCECVDMYGLVQSLWDWLRLILWWKFDIFELFLYLLKIERKGSWGDVQKPFVSMWTCMAQYKSFEIGWDWFYGEILIFLKYLSISLK